MPDVATKPPFEAYAGSQPYLFISYSHKDSGAVFPIIDRLHGQGYRIWYDEGIDPGNEWPEEIARALGESAFFVVFISPQAVGSRNVRNEINFALNYGKPLLAIYLEETTLPQGLELRMGDIQALFKHRQHEESFQRKMAKALPETLIEEPAGDAGKEKPPAEAPAPKHRPVFAILALSLLLVGGLIYGGARYLPRKPASEPPDQVAVVPSPLPLPEEEPAVIEEVPVVEETVQPPPVQNAALLDAENAATAEFAKASELAVAWDGYKTPLGEIEAQLKLGKALRADKKDKEALERFEAVIQECSDLQEMEPVRQSALREKAGMEDARAEAQKAYAAKDAGKLVGEAEALERQALREYESRAFHAAAGRWRSAADVFQRSETYARGIRKTRKIAGILERTLSAISKDFDLPRDGGSVWDEFGKQMRSAKNAEKNEDWTAATECYQRAALALKEAANHAAMAAEAAETAVDGSMDSFMDDMRKETKGKQKK